MARIDHGVEIVDVRHDHFGPLPYPLVVLGDEADREDIGSKECLGWRQGVGDDAEETLDRRQPERLRVRQDRVGGVVVAVAVEAHVVELDLVKPLVCQVSRDLGDVLGDPRFIGIEPDVAAEIGPWLACLGVVHGQLRLGLGHRVVLHDHQPRDRVDAARLELGEQRVEVQER